MRVHTHTRCSTRQCRCCCRCMRVLPTTRLRHASAAARTVPASFGPPRAGLLLPCLLRERVIVPNRPPMPWLPSPPAGLLPPSLRVAVVQDRPADRQGACGW
jgi:hypothetical protein